MKCLYWICLCSFGLVPIATLAQPGISDLNIQRANVILIHAARPNGATETAAGFYIGRDEANAYFVTALHALRDETTKQWANDIQVQFWGSGASHPATIFDRFSEIEDLAVLLLPTKELVGNLVSMEQKDPTAELNIHLIGHPVAGTWLPWVGSVQNEYEADDPNRFTTNLDPSLQHGYSGSPVFDTRGNLIGMHLAATNSSVNLNSRYIVMSLLAWHLPTSNLRSSLVPEGTPDPNKNGVVKLVANFEEENRRVLGVQKWERFRILTRQEVEEFSSNRGDEVKRVFHSTHIDSALANSDLLNTRFYTWGSDIAAMRALGFVPITTGTYVEYLDSVILRYGDQNFSELFVSGVNGMWKDGTHTFRYLQESGSLKVDPAWRSKKVSEVAELLRPNFKQMDEQYKKFLAWWRGRDIQLTVLNLGQYLEQDEGFKTRFQALLENDLTKGLVSSIEQNFANRGTQVTIRNPMAMTISDYLKAFVEMSQIH
jgi:trypsin-like peptidase